MCELLVKSMVEFLDKSLREYSKKFMEKLENFLEECRKEWVNSNSEAFLWEFLDEFSQGNSYRYLLSNLIVQSRNHWDNCYCNH